MPGITREWADSLRMIVTAAIGEDVSYEDAIEYVNRYPDIMSQTTLHPYMDPVLLELCEQEEWPTPTTFILNTMAYFSWMLI